MKGKWEHKSVLSRNKHCGYDSGIFTLANGPSGDVAGTYQSAHLSPKKKDASKTNKAHCRILDRLLVLGLNYGAAKSILHLLLKNMGRTLATGTTT